MVITYPFQDRRFHALTSKHHRGSASTAPNPANHEHIIMMIFMISMIIFLIIMIVLVLLVDDAAGVVNGGGNESNDIDHSTDVLLSISDLQQR